VHDFDVQLGNALLSLRRGPPEDFARTLAVARKNLVHSLAGS
jgi:hypothetical protein